MKGERLIFIYDIHHNSKRFRRIQITLDMFSRLCQPSVSCWTMNMSPLICSAPIHRPYHSYNLNLVLAQQRIENIIPVLLSRWPRAPSKHKPGHRQHGTKVTKTRHAVTQTRGRGWSRDGTCHAACCIRVNTSPGAGGRENVYKIDTYNIKLIDFSILMETVRERQMSLLTLLSLLSLHNHPPSTRA